MQMCWLSDEGLGRPLRALKGGGRGDKGFQRQGPPAPWSTQEHAHRDTASALSRALLLLSTLHSLALLSLPPCPAPLVHAWHRTNLLPSVAGQLPPLPQPHQ